MPFPLEAVPNFSEGRDAAVVGALADSLGEHAGVRLLDVHSDAGHNRSVFTLAGGERELIESLLAGVATAKERIDLRAHEGVHPRAGAADVLPLVAVRPEDMGRANGAAFELARRIGEELELPVFLYGDLAGGRKLAALRRGGVEGLAERMESGEAMPDFGPKNLDPRWGAALVTARRPLIAFNVNLRGSLEAAREIAAIVREGGASSTGRGSQGGFPGVRALGLQLPVTGLVQVSMNVEDWQAAPLNEIVERVDREAAARGAEIAGSELVGLIPEGAVPDDPLSALRLERLERSQILELRLADELGSR